MIDARYKAQVDLLLQALPFVAKEKNLALKGGSAINLFVRELPRLSVDIDLTYLPFDDRDTALENISASLARIKEGLENTIPIISVTAAKREGQDVKINCQIPGAQIKIEVNTTTRGHIKPTRFMEIKEAIEDEFKKYAAINVVSHAELYGGKICAALDRQHPRDLFDVKLLFEYEGFTQEVKEGFLIALISHMRPINEIIKPSFIGQKDAYDNQFSGMTTIEFSYDDYENTKIELVEKLFNILTDEDKKFLMSFKMGRPDWDLLSFKDAKRLPAVQWKLQNIHTLIENNPRKHSELLSALGEILFGQ